MTKQEAGRRGGIASGQSRKAKPRKKKVSPKKVAEFDRATALGILAEIALDSQNEANRIRAVQSYLLETRPVVDSDPITEDTIDSARGIIDEAKEEIDSWLP